MTGTLEELPRASDLSAGNPRFTRWINNFNTGLTALGSASSTATAIGGSGTAGPPATGLLLVSGITALWNAAYAQAANTATRTHANIVALKVLRNNPSGLTNVLGALGPAVPGQNKGIVGVLRSLARTIQGTGTSTPSILGNLGLTQHTKVRSLPQIPTKGPELTLDPSPPHTVIVRYHQEGAAESSKSKPRGCKGCLLKWQCANGSSGSMMFTKTPCSMDVGQANSGQAIRISGTWAMGNSKESPPGNTITGGVP